jgi:hypothetical protein
MEKMDTDTEYKEWFRGVLSYRLYTRWIQRTSVSHETKSRVWIDTGDLKEYQVRFIYENHKQDLQNIFEKKVSLKGVKL